MICYPPFCVSALYKILQHADWCDYMLSGLQCHTHFSQYGMGIAARQLAHWNQYSMFLMCLCYLGLKHDYVNIDTAGEICTFRQS